MADLESIKAAHKAVSEANDEIGNTKPGTLERLIAEEHAKQAREELNGLITGHVVATRKPIKGK